MAPTRLDADRRRALLARAEELGSVSAACAEIGVSRDSYYRILRAVEREGESAFAVADRRRQRRVSPALEARILAITVARPWLGKLAVSQELRAEGNAVSANGVRQVWVRHALTGRADRIAYASARNGGRPIDIPVGRRRTSGEGEGTMPAFPWDFEISEPARKAIRRETDLVSELVERQRTAQGTHDWPSEVRAGSSNQVLVDRLRRLKNAKLFLNPKRTTRESPGKHEIVQMMARVAVQCHGLRYDQRVTEWSLDRDAAERGRSEGWFGWQFGGDRNTIQLVDLALIAHSFGLPYEIWTIPDGEAFQEVLDVEVKLRGTTRSLPDDEGSLLASSPVDYLMHLSRSADGVTDRGMLIEIFHANNWRAHAGQEKRVNDGTPRLRAGTPLHVSLCVPQAFVGGMCCLFEVDADRDVSLLSRAVEPADLALAAGTYRYPPSEIEGARDLEVSLAASSASRIVAILVAPSRVKDLLSCSFLAESRNTRNIVLRDDHLLALKKLLLALPKRERLIFHREIILAADPPHVDDGVSTSSA